MIGMYAQTYTVHDKREYSVSAAVGGTVMIADASHPTSVTVNQEFPWHVVGHVEGATVHNPCIGYYYKDGPAGNIVIVKNDGSQVNLPKGYVYVLYYHADKPVCTNVDSRDVVKGAKFPVEGTYTIWLLSGVLSEDEAAMGRFSLAGYKEFTTRHVKGVGFPVYAEAKLAYTSLYVFGPIALAGLALLAAK